MLNKILEILVIPIMILNFASGIVGGIWLAFLGEWKLIGIGVLLMIASPWFLSILMMPGLLISGIALKYANKNKIIFSSIGFMSQLYTNILITSTCVFAFLVCSSFYKGEVGVGYIPYILWSWGMALGPWQFFASKEPANEFSTITLFSASILYFLFLGSIFISPVLSLLIVVMFALVQLLLLPAFNVFLASKMDNQ
jgi:hypothetical protein